MQNNDAVSPVIGVILMVAITIVLATVVIILMQNFDAGEQSPNLSATRNGDTITITRANPNLPWADLAVNGCTNVPTTGNVTAGQTLTGCTGTVTIVHAPTNSVIYRD